LEGNMTTGRRGILGWIGGLAAAPATSAAAPRSRSLAGRLLDEIEKLPVFDSHEHIMPEKGRLALDADFFTLAGHYAIDDVSSAGLLPEDRKLIQDAKAPLEARWKAFEPYWRYARSTGYGRALRLAVRDLYGAGEISRATLEKINGAMRAENTPGLYQRVLREKAGIRFAVVDDNWNAGPVKPDSDIFLVARKFDRFILPSGRPDVERLERLTDSSITTLPGLKQAMEKQFRQCLELPMAAVKSTIAYNRELLFEEVPETAAAADFDALLAGARPMPAGFRSYNVRPYRQLEDHMFHHLIRLAEAHGLPVQIHTGLLAGNGAFVANTNARHLTNLFYLFPKVPFDLFHISYPYQNELAVLAKLFPNVHVDFCWAHIISPSGARRALDEFLDTVPANKIFGFGGDYRYPELSYAHARMARRNIAQVLAERTERGDTTEDEAVETARWLLHDNAARLFSPKPRA
jgi:predicted TIM-barrel fold metal-dependent hydrolase